MSEIKVSVGMDTNKLQLKLKAIAKHAEALAKELDEIDEAECPQCGSCEHETIFYGHYDYKHGNKLYICRDCGHQSMV